MQMFAPVRLLDARSLGGPTLEVRIPPGTALAQEGDVLGTFFLIRAGTAELWREGTLCRVLESGDCFGEVDGQDGRPQPYTVLAGPGLRVLTFSALGIERMCASVPRLRERLLASLPAAT